MSCWKIINHIDSGLGGHHGPVWSRKLGNGTGLSTKKIDGAWEWWYWNVRIGSSVGDRSGSLEDAFRDADAWAEENLAGGQP